MNRRKFLLGMGTAAAGSGVVFGSGAFTQTQVDRDVQLQFANDSNAQVTIEVDENPSGVAATTTNNNTEVQLDFGSGNGLNVDGVSLFRDVLEVTNNNDDADAEIYLAVAAGDTNDYQRARGRVLATRDDSTTLGSLIDGTNITVLDSNVRDISAEDGLYSGVSQDLRFALKDNSTYGTGVIGVPNGENTHLSFEYEAGNRTRTSDQFTNNFRLKAFSAEEFSSKSDLSGNRDVFVDDDLSIQYGDTTNVDSFDSDES